MEFLSIILFFLYTWSFGFGVCRFVKESENSIEKNLMRIGVGLGIFIFLGFVFNLLRIPLDWRIFLFLSILLLIFYFVKNYKNIINKKPRISISKSNINILVMLLLFSATFYIYHKGAFIYPFLEDDDSWSHALSVKYISVEKTVFKTTSVSFHYLDPYPPAYDMLFGILHQTNNSIYWTLKFFNTLIISLSIIFFYFFVKEFTGNRNKALFSTFALASVPAYLSHFIWSLALTVPLYFVSFYCAERIKYDKKWAFVAAPCIMVTLTSSPSHSAYFGFFFILYLVTKMILQRKLLFYEALAGIVGVLLSFILWWIPMFLKYGFIKTLVGLGIEVGTKEVLSIYGTADRIYNLNDFVWAKEVNMINNPIGIGFILSILLIVSLVPIYHYLFKISFKIKEKSNIKFYIITLAEIISIILLLTGLFLFLNSNKFDTRNIEQVKMLKQHMKLTLPYIFFSILILISITFYLSRIIVEDYRWVIISLTLLLFTFYAVNAVIYPYRLSPFRAWMLFVIPLSILVSEGMWFLMDNLKKIGISKAITLVVVLIGIFFTSTQQKIAVNTAIWPPGAFWTSFDEVNSYVWIKDNLPKNSKLFTFVNNGAVIGMDMSTCHWCDEVRNYQKNGFNQTAEENYNWLKRTGYSFVIIDGQTVRKFGANASNEKLKDYSSSGLFQPVFQNQGAIILKIV